MHIIYIDDSGDEKVCIFSALVIPVSEWNNALTQVRDFRRELRDQYGIYVHKELHGMGICCW